MGISKKKKTQLRFIDSIRFMASSLDSLSSNLVGVSNMKCATCSKDCEFTQIDSDYVAHGKCKNSCSGYSKRQLNREEIYENFHNMCEDDDEKFRLLLRKGVYPYEYMDGWNRFVETQLPSGDKFYSKLNMSHISENDHVHAQRVWKAFDLKNMGEYHDLYLKTDVLLLANVFESFHDTCMKHYGLDPAHFYTSPGLAWQACLKKTGIWLELLSEPDILLMFEKGIRGGLTQAVQRYAKANNKYMGDKYDLNKESSYLQYLDANNLYGWAMSQPLPMGEFRWMDDVDQLDSKKINEMAREIGKGSLLEVDLDYPVELHGKHNDLPFMPEKMKTNKFEKLIPNLFDTKKYVIHIRALNQAFVHGLVLEKVHRVIEFDQSPWLKSYIDFNTKLGMDAKNDFERDFFKLMNNSVFGKTMENIRNHKDIRLAANEETYQVRVTFWGES